MSDYILYTVVELQGFLILSVAILFLVTVLTLLLMGRKRLGMKDFGWQGFFLGRTARELLLVATALLQFAFICAAAFFRMPMETVQIAALAILCAAKGILSFSLPAFAGEAAYGVLMGAALTIGNLLQDYMRQTGVEAYIGLIWGLLILFILLYAAYWFLKSLERILLRYEKTGRKKNLFYFLVRRRGGGGSHRQRGDGAAGAGQPLS